MAVIQVLGLNDYCESRMGDLILGSSQQFVSFAVLPWSTVATRLGN